MRFERDEPRSRAQLFFMVAKSISHKVLKTGASSAPQVLFTSSFRCSNGSPSRTYPDPSPVRRQRRKQHSASRRLSLFASRDSTPLVHRVRLGGAGPWRGPVGTTIRPDLQLADNGPAFVVQIYSQSPCSAVFRGRAQACELVVRDVVDLLFVAVVEPARSGVSIVVAVGEVCSGDDQYVVLY
jgi:hypothetical protein